MTVALRFFGWTGFSLWRALSPVVAQRGRQISDPFATSARQMRETLLRIPTTEVQLVVTVRDSLGQAVTDLHPADFLMYDNGKRYEPTQCESRQLPTHVLLLLLDASSTWEGGTEFLSQALERFRRAWSPPDGLAVMQFTDEVVLTQDWARPPTAAALRRALRPALRPIGRR